jgi:two-component system, OmpR family, response regulator
MRVLVLEDDAETARMIERGLRHEGHEVVCAGDVAGAIAAATAGGALDAAVLDLMVPGGSGYDVLEHLRREREGIPVLVLTARDAVSDRVAGLDRGADDYLVKPFSLAELLARLRAIQRRAAASPERLRRHGLEIDFVARACRIRSAEVELTRIEFDLLACLMREDGGVVGREQLLREVWRIDFDPGTNVVDVHVHRLRRKLEDAGGRGLVRTVRGRGYAIG